MNPYKFSDELIMKVIISHDVDHIDVTDHFFKDLSVEKMIIRSFVQFVSNNISFSTFIYRLTVPFRKRMNRIEEVIRYDKEHNIPSVFFFGMSSALGMSYSRKKAKKYIDVVVSNGFDAGVHGCEYDNLELIREEHDSFRSISGMNAFGIRNHYVRFNSSTFEKMEKAGYLFDSTYFNKKHTELIEPYKVGNMWEFPLHIMDGYVCEHGKEKESLEKTRSIIDEADRKGLNYLTILFHDYQFDNRYDPQLKHWYEETIGYCEEKGFEFVSYRDAIRELENDLNGVR